MNIRERKIRVTIYLLCSIYVLINVCFSLYTIFWARILLGLICLAGGCAVIPLKQQAKPQETDTPELKRIYSTLLTGHGILALTLLIVLLKTFMG